MLYYGNKAGDAAYRQAIDQTHFGTIYLTLNTVNSRKINEYLTNSRRRTGCPKRSFLPTRTICGDYLVWTPKVLGR